MNISSINELVQRSKNGRRLLFKLMTELAELRSNKILMRCEADQLLISFYDQTNCKKVVQVKSSWLAILAETLRSDWFCIDDQVPSMNFKWPTENFKAVVKMQDCLVLFKCQITAAKIELTNFSYVKQLDDALGLLNMDAKSQVAAKDLYTKTEGILYIAASNAECLLKARGLWAALLGGHYLGELRQQSVRNAITNLPTRELHTVGIIAETPVLAIQQVQGYSDLKQSLNDNFLAFTGFPRALCPDCPGTMRLAVNQFLLDTKYKQSEWQNKIPTNDQLCSGCAGYGYKGWECVAQIFEFDQGLLKKLDNKTVPITVDTILKQCGYKRFYDIAIELALDGKTDMAALHDCRIQAGNDGSDATQHIIIEDDFFEVVPQSKKIGTTNATQVLIIEDDLDQRHILELALQELGCAVSTAENGLEALGFLQNNQPNLIITDLMMPKMNGMEFVEKIKGQAAYKDIAVMVLTVLNDPDKEYKLLDLGVDDYCEKGTPRKVLLKRIENLVRRSQGECSS